MTTSSGSTSMVSMWQSLLSKLTTALEADPGASEINRVFGECAELDRQVEAKIKGQLASVWSQLQSKTIKLNADAVQKLLAQTPSPLTQIFVEAELPSSEDIVKSIATAAGHTSCAGNVVVFFLQSLFGQAPGPVDEKILDHLISIESVTLAEPKFGFEIKFTFGEGAKKFFSNSTLSVSVISQGSTQGGIALRECCSEVVGTKINWAKSDADPTVMRIPVPPQAENSKKKNRDGTAPKKAAPQFVEVKQDSFFRIFESFSLTEAAATMQEGEDEEAAMEHQMEMIRRSRLVDSLIEYHQLSAFFPILSLKRILPEPEEMGDDMQPFGDEEDEEMDGDFEDGEDEEEEDEEVEQAPVRKASRTEMSKKSNATPPAPAAAGKGKQAPDCKHQ